MQPDKNELPDGKKARARLDLANDSIKKALSFLECFGFQAEGKTALEIGCYDGARSFALAEQGIDQVTGSDIARYYVRESDKDPDAAQKKSIYLEELRNMIRAASKGPADKVRFIEDDITQSGLPAASVDLVCSWEVLEHVQDPAKLFYQINRLLKPGGIAFHEYNPFFAINGGHSWCTLDFLWGHVLLKDREFEKYLARFRPPEMNEALNFYNKSLNRMTMGELERVSAEEGLNTLGLIPWTEKEHLELLTASIFRQAKENYPSITAQDLSSPFVWVVQTKS
ncbi:MAG: class I SAM-dependent methyltransferase [Nitrospiraceae bacterium]|nr:class I SAM-dependent methyltransferase [Nitrospiraceae bacterium]